MRKSESAGKIHLASYEDLFTPTESRNTVPPSDNIQQINIEKLDTFKNHPYPVVDDEEMQQLEDSIRENGIITPLLVRPQASESYEIISGHRRCYAARKAGLTSVPVIVRKLSDDESIMLMVDANAQREHIPLSVKAKAYKMKLDAMKRQGARTDLTSSQVGTRSESEATSSQVGTRSESEATSSQVGTRSESEATSSQVGTRSESEVTSSQVGTKSESEVTSSQVGTNLIKSGIRADALLAEQVGESRNQIQRYIRLTF